MNGGSNGQQPDNQEAGWVFKPGGSAASPSPQTTGGAQETPTKAPSTSLEWTASEYIAHEKHAGWYAQVLVAGVVVAILVYIITRDVISAGVIVFAGVIFAVAAARKPRVIAYRVDSGGLTAGQRYFPFSQFKSYAIMQEGPLTTVVFMPLKRFMPTVDVHIPPENAEAILTVLSTSLPLETRKPGLVDTFTNRIRF